MNETKKCHNCGCDSHCGTICKRTEKGYKCDDLWSGEKTREEIEEELREALEE